MSVIPHIYKSIIRNTQDLITKIGDTTGNRDIQFHQWDARMEENKLPEATLLGIEGFTFQENGGLWVVRYGLTLSTWQDLNLLDEIEIVGILHDVTGEKTKVAMLDDQTGTEVGEMICSAWELAPAVQTSLRNYKSVGIELLRAGE